MTYEHDDAAEDVLAGIDLQVWRVPPPATLDRPALLGRALSPIGAPAKRRRVAWILAAVVLVNAAIAALLVIVLARPSVEPAVVVEPAGGGSVDAQVREVLERLEQEQREVERKLAEIQELRALVLELSEKVRRYEQHDEKRDRQPPKRRERQPADPIDRRPVDPFDAAAPPGGTCDEVGCVLTNYQDACCARFRSPRVPSTTPTSSADNLPDSLDRTSITKTIASVRARVAACANRSTAKGKVKVRIRVEPRGQVSNIVIEATPDPALGLCVAGAVRSAVFPRTRNGGSFTYPFVF